MKIFYIFKIFYILILFSNSVYAVSLFSPKKKTSSVSFDEEPKLKLSVFGSPGAESYKLTSSTSEKLNLGLPFSRSFAFGGSLQYQIKPEILDLRARFESRTITRTRLTFVTPDSITDKRNHGDLSIFIKPIQETDNPFLSHLKLVMGYFLITHDAKETHPQAILTSSISHGPVLGVNYLQKINEDYYFESSLDSFFISSFKESFQATGFFRSGNIFTGEIHFGTHLTRFIDAVIGVKGRYETLKFLGQGFRNAVDATEVSSSVQIPLEVRIRF